MSSIGHWFVLYRFWNFWQWVSHLHNQLLESSTRSLLQSAFWLVKKERRMEIRVKLMASLSPVGLAWVVAFWLFVLDFEQLVRILVFVVENITCTFKLFNNLWNLLTPAKRPTLELLKTDFRRDKKKKKTIWLVYRVLTQLKIKCNIKSGDNLYSWSWIMLCKK